MSHEKQRSEVVSCVNRQQLGTIWPMKPDASHDPNGSVIVLVWGSEVKMIGSSTTLTPSPAVPRHGSVSPSQWDFLSTFPISGRSRGIYLPPSESTDPSFQNTSGNQQKRELVFQRTTVAKNKKRNQPLETWGRKKRTSGACLEIKSS